MIDAGEFAALLGPDFAAWLHQMERLGGCAAPVYLVGHTITRDAATGDVLHVFTSASQPYGRFAVGCRNRRESVCPACAFLHHGDTYQIVVSGLAGGKGVPVDVVSHPRVFVTLTAPSFGAVHRAAGADGARCRPRRGGGVCAHGAALSCSARHADADPLVGVPLCAECYDYAGAVLWNASLGRLWHDAVIYTRRELAKSAGIAVRALREHARVSFAKVVEFQRRGSVHLHAVVRIDGPGGPDDPAPSWASAVMLGDAVAAAVARVRKVLPKPVLGVTGDGLRGAVRAEVGSKLVPGVTGQTIGERVLTFGARLDVQEIRAGTALDGLSDAAVAAYVAKYVTKGDIAGLVLPHRLRSERQIDATPGLTEHARQLMRTAFELGGLEPYEDLRLRTWAHQLGFRGHILTKSLRYSTTYTALRAARATFHRAGSDDGAQTVTESVWRLDHVGHTPSEAALARAIASETRAARAAKRKQTHADRRAWAGGRVSAASGRRPGADRDQTRAPRGPGGEP